MVKKLDFVTIYKVSSLVNDRLHGLITHDPSFFITIFLMEKIGSALFSVYKILICFHKSYVVDFLDF